MALFCILINFIPKTNLSLNIEKSISILIDKIIILLNCQNNNYSKVITLSERLYNEIGKGTLSVLCILYFGAILCSSQGLFLILCSRKTPGRTQ